MTPTDITSARAEKYFYTVNRRLLLSTLLVIAGLGVGGYFWYQYRLDRTSSALIERAEKLEEEGDWNGAATYYQRYLIIDPENTDVLVRLVQAYSKGEVIPARMVRLNTLLYRVLGRLPERDDLRQMLATNLLKTGALEEAADEADKLLDGKSEIAREARKIIAISQIARASRDNSIVGTDVLRSLLEAASESPEDLELIEVAANSLRIYPNELAKEMGDAASQADKLMDQLVTARPDDVQVRMARYRYRKRYSLPDAEKDLKAALTIAPNNPEALLSSAMAKLDRTSTDSELKEADDELIRVIEQLPGDHRPYIARAELLRRQRNPDGAKSLLKSALKATDGNFEIGLALCSLQLESQDLEEAEATLKQLRSDSSIHLVRLEREKRNQLHSRLRIISARLSLAQGRPEKAIADLKATYLNEEAATTGQPSQDWVQAAQMLATYYGQLEEWDLAGQYLDSLSHALPGRPEFIEAAVSAALKSGNAQLAVAHLDRFSRIGKLTEGLKVQLVQSHLLLQLHRPIDKRNWTEFQSALEAARHDAVNRWELLFAEVDYLRAKGEDNGPILAMIRQGESQFAENESFWRNAALQYNQLRAADDQQRALKRYKDVAKSVVEPVLLEASLLARDKRFSDADDLLTKTAQLLPISERPAIQRQLVVTVAQEGDLGRAKQLAKELITNYPDDQKLLILGAEVSLAAGDFDTARKWEEQLASNPQGRSTAQFLKCNRLIQSYNSLKAVDRLDLEQTLTAIRAERPQWYPVVAIAARYAELSGDLRQAAEDYRLAIDLGDRRPFTLQQLVTLLYRLDRVDDADTYLALLSSDESAASFVNAMSLEFAVKKNRPEEALELARQNVKRFPQDATRRIYLANLLLRYGKTDETEAVLRKAMQDLPSDQQVWMGMVSYLAQSNRIDEARAILESNANSEKTGSTNSHAFIAQGFETIGDLVAAAGQYVLALKQDPSDTQMRLRYARLLSRGAFGSARQEYERILELEPTNIDARRELAVVLASSGVPADWVRANQLLESVDSNAVGDANTNDRLRAMLLSQRGRTRDERIRNCRAAREILNKQIVSASGEDANLARLLLVQLLEREASLSGDSSLSDLAREQFEAILENGNPSAERLVLYIEFLLGQARKSETAKFEKRAELENASATSSEPSVRSEQFLSEAEDRLEELHRFQSDGDVELESVSIAISAQILKLRGKANEAKAVVDEYVAGYVKTGQSPGSLQRYITVGRLYSQLDEHSEAEKWYRRAMELNPRAYELVVDSLLARGDRSGAAQLCMSLSTETLSPNIAKKLANILTVTDDVATFGLPEAEQALQTALQANQNDLDLLQAEAIRRASRGEYDEAIAAFTQIIQLDPANHLALNNLATILAEKPNRRADALELIQRAIELGGRQASLLDTQGTIYLKLGRIDEAIACLEESTAGGTADPRYYLHLAAAYHLARRDDDALRMLEEAEGFNLEKFLLTEDDRRLLDELNKAFSIGAQL